MTQKQEISSRMEEWKQLFLALDDNGREQAMAIIKSLEFAQSVLASPSVTERGGKT